MTATLFDYAQEIGHNEFKAPDYEPGASLESRFRTFHQANPWVLDALIGLARDMRRTRDRRVGIGMLFEVLRWQSWRHTSGDEFKLNNSYRSRYARLIMERCPDLADAFETRGLTS